MDGIEINVKEKLTDVLEKWANTRGDELVKVVKSWLNEHGCEKFEANVTLKGQVTLRNQKTPIEIYLIRFESNIQRIVKEEERLVKAEKLI